jgi:hypothetical protein
MVTRDEIAFVHQVGRAAPFTDGIYAIRPDGGRLRRLTGDAPNWSPHGTKIVFSRGDALWTMRGTGADVRRLTTPADHHELSAPDWQPRPG